MRKQLRRAIMLALAVIIITAAPLMNAFADEPAIEVAPEPAIERAPNEETMEAALIAVRRLIGLDEDVFTDFSYHSSFSNWQTREGLIWTFYWNSRDNNAFVYASATAEGKLLDYRNYNWEERSFGFAEVGKDEAIAKADAFIKAANPDSYSYYKAPEGVWISIGSSEYNFSYVAEVNGRPFSATGISVQVNKFTGDVTGYNTGNIEPGNFIFEDATPIISESAAISAYAEKIGLTLEYRSSHDWQEGTITVFPAYTLNSYDGRFIGARSGDVVQHVYDRGGGEMDEQSALGPAEPEASAANDSAGGGFDRTNLTPAEIAALERVGELITSDKALENLFEIMELPNLDVEGFDEQMINLRRDHFDRERFFYEINLYKWFGMEDMAEDELTGVYGRVDADTGRVVAFNRNLGYGIQTWNETPAFSALQAEAAAEAFLKRHAPDEHAKSKTDSSSAGVPTPRWGGNYSFNYVRHENDTPFRDNGINISVDPNTGKIMSYSLNWFENISFPSVRNVLTPVRALTAFVEQNGSSIYYITTGESNAALVYDFTSWGLINPFTGKAMDFSGAPWEENAVATPAYDDVKGHWSDSYVTRLLDNGVFHWGGAFEPDRAMTQQEFLQYIMLANTSFPITPLSRISERGFDIDADSDKILTRQEAARIVVEYLGYGKVAEQSEWFIYPFNDAVDEQFRGYITIAYILGIIGSGDNGNFNAASNVTRAHAAVILTNIILAGS